MVVIDLSESGMNYCGGGGGGAVGSDSSYDEEGTTGGRMSMCTWSGHRGGGGGGSNVGGCLAPISSSSSSASSARNASYKPTMPPTTTTASSSFRMSAVSDSKKTMDLKSWSTQHLRDLFRFGVDKSIIINNNNNDTTTTAETSTSIIPATAAAAAASSASAAAADMKNAPIDEISEALNQLSFDQRQDAYHDVHGIARDYDDDNDIVDIDIDFDDDGGGGPRLPKEDPEMIRQRLRELEQYLIKAVYYSSSSSSSYHQSSSSSSPSSSSSSSLKLAMEQNPSYVQGTDFRLLFLRAEDYDAKLACARLLNFLDMKRELFGDEKLTKDITLDDLDDDDMHALRSGGFQILPIPDRSGRRVIFGPAKLERFRAGGSFVSFVLPLLCLLGDVCSRFCIDTWKVVFCTANIPLVALMIVASLFSHAPCCHECSSLAMSDKGHVLRFHVSSER